jgi:hypothetical protein
VSAVPKGVTAPDSQRTPVSLHITDIMAGAKISEWAPYIYGVDPNEVAAKAKEWKNGSAAPPTQAAPPTNNGTSNGAPPRSGPPPRKPKEAAAPTEPKFYLDLGNDQADPQLVPKAQLKELVSSMGKVAFEDWKVCPDGGEEWKSIQDAIPESKDWAPF